MDPRTERMLAARRQGQTGSPGQKKSSKVRPQMLILALLGGAAAYYFFMMRPEAERRQAEADAQSEARQAAPMPDDSGWQACFEGVDRTYEAEWEAACTARQLQTHCALPASITQQMNERRLSARSACLNGGASAQRTAR
jgi:hypothetical protein